MFDNYVIEIRPKAAGITVQAGIVVPRWPRLPVLRRDPCVSHPLEGHLFKNPREAEKAALRQVTGAERARAAQRGQTYSHIESEQA